MTQYDCFNGDADGICALTQLRLAQPLESELITGVKRDINLLRRVAPIAGDRVTALDISLDKNRSDLNRILSAGAEVFYCDHHFAGDIPSHPKLEAIINTKPDVCTSLLINKTLNGQYLDWAIAGTFGDNLKASARSLARTIDLNEEQLVRLENLGVYLNYNGYGSHLDDLYFHPAELYKKTVMHESAFGFMHDDSATFAVLEDGYLDDMSKAANSNPIFNSEAAAVFKLPNASWARRVSGVFGNDLANQVPERAHAVVTVGAQGGYVVSVREPLNRKTGADEICRQFASGGGRAAAAGINDLPETELDSFIRIFADYYDQ